MRLPKAYDDGYVSVVYSDSDDGRTQKRLIGTSQLKRGAKHTLGRALHLAAAVGRCELKEGRLRFLPAPLPDLDTAEQSPPTDDDLMQ